jgi:uncharacterized protein YbjT (DUF2867 family)
MRVLLAGATGAVGSEVLDLLRADGHEVRTLSRDPERSQRLRGRASDVRVADATEPGALLGVCDGVQVVLSCLGANVGMSLRERRGFDAVDTMANLALLEEAKRAGVTRFVYLAAAVDTRTEKTSYISAHERVVQALAQSGLDSSVVRPTGIFSAFTDFPSMAKRGPLPRIGSGEARTNPIHHRDVARAIVSVLERGPRELPIGGPDVLSRKRIAELAFEVQGLRPRLIAVPAILFRLVALLLGVIRPRLGQMIAFVENVSTHDCIAPVGGELHLADFLRASAEEGRTRLE